MYTFFHFICQIILVYIIPENIYPPLGLFQIAAVDLMWAYYGLISPPDVNFWSYDPYLLQNFELECEVYNLEWLSLLKFLPCNRPRPYVTRFGRKGSSKVSTERSLGI